MSTVSKLCMTEIRDLVKEGAMKAQMVSHRAD